MPDALLTEQRLREALGTRPFRFYTKAGSTNDLGQHWALDGAPAGAVVVAEEQVAGRGRFGRAWLAPTGTALLFSVVLRPHVEAQRLTRLTMIGAVAVAETLMGMAPGAVRLKWPNDVWLAGHKVAGILPEAIWLGSDLQAVVLGIGVNVSVDFAGTPLADSATSIEMITGKSVDRAALLAAILGRIDDWAARVEEPALLETWRGWLETLGRRVLATSSGEQISGKALDVDDNGALLLRVDDGSVRRVMSGEVTLAE
jgi:BirA family biotin operon repressor/biotin-[acetyl-CoA-carboxylase] ligase